MCRTFSHEAWFNVSAFNADIGSFANHEIDVLVKDVVAENFDSKAIVPAFGGSIEESIATMRHFTATGSW